MFKYYLSQATKGKEMKTKYKDEDYRRQLSFVVEHLARVTNLPSGKCYAICRRTKLVDNYGADFCCFVLSRIQQGFNVSYCIGAIKNEYIKTGEFESKLISDIAESISI